MKSDSTVNGFELLAPMFVGLGGTTAGEPGEVWRDEIHQAVERLRESLGLETIIVLDGTRDDLRTIAAAGNADVLDPAVRAELSHRATEDSDPVEHEDVLAVATAEQPRIVVLVKPIPSDQAQAALRLAAAWLSSERRRTERLERWLEDARTHKHESLTHFAKRAAHDFRNSLAAILSHAEFALDQTEQGRASYEPLEDVVLAAREASKQVDMLMTFGGVLDGPAPQPVPLQPQINGAFPVLRALVPEHIELTASVDPTATGCIQPTHLRQLLVHVVANAAQAIGTQPGRIDLTVRDQGTSFAEIVIEDDGQGMDSGVLRRAADPFFTTHKGNHGLGLAVATGIARSVGGELALSSEPGRGTRVRIIIPRRPNVASADIA